MTKLWWIGMFSFALACGGSNNGGGTNNGNNGSNNGANNGAMPTTGEEVYSQRLAGGNTFTCSTCHALSEPADDGFHRPGHPIGDAFGRPSYKNGQLTELRDAVNTCVTEWMVADALEEDDPRWVLLRDWLEEMSEGESEPLTFEVVPPPTDLTGGDPVAGNELFNTSCAVCHGTDAAGTLKAPALGGLGLQPELIARRIRTSGAAGSPTYEGLTGGVMPFWAADRLSDDQVLDLVAFVAEAEFIDPNNVSNNGTNNGATNNGTRECDTTHPNIGQTMTFTTFSHGVSGTATIVDDCTIQVADFNYDGGGIEVRVYAAEGGDYRNGFSVSEDLYRPGNPYAGESITLTLPEGRTLDEVDGLSVWCVAAGVSFGDGEFE